MSEPRTIDLAIPPLEEGQTLDRFEFERRYEAMPHVKKAELIEGVVHMPSPVSLDHHGEQHLCLATLARRLLGSDAGVARWRQFHGSSRGR